MYYIIVNPASKSGRGVKIWSLIEPVLQKKEIEYKVFFSQRAGHVVKLVQDLSASLLKEDAGSILKLILLGGDGTLNEALQGITDFGRVQVGYIPTGSSNDMARDLKLSADPLVMLDRILSCQKATCMDLGLLTYEDTAEELSRQHSDEVCSMRYFAVGCGIGFDAAVCEEALNSNFKNVLNRIGLGKLTYLTIALKQLMKAKKVGCTITLDGKQTVELSRFLFVAFMNHQYQGGGFKFCPGADCHDGVFDICTAGNIPKWLILIALPTAYKGKHYRFNGINRYSASDVRLEATAPLWVHTDGEVARKSRSIHMKCLKEPLQFLL